MRLADGTYYANCRRAEPGDPPLAVAYADPPQDLEWYPPTDEYRSIEPEADRVEDQKYNEDAFGDELDGSADIYLRAGYKTGKTTSVRRVVRAARRQIAKTQKDSPSDFRKTNCSSSARAAGFSESGALKKGREAEPHINSLTGPRLLCRIRG